MRKPAWLAGEILPNSSDSIGVEDCIRTENGESIDLALGPVRSRDADLACGIWTPQRTLAWPGRSEGKKCSRLVWAALNTPSLTTTPRFPPGALIDGIFGMPIPTVTGRNHRIWVTRDLQNWTLQATLTGDGTEQLFEFDETTVPAGPLHSDTHPSSYFFRVEILIP